MTKRPAPTASRSSGFTGETMRALASTLLLLGLMKERPAVENRRQASMLLGKSTLAIENPAEAHPVDEIRSRNFRRAARRQRQ